MINTSHSNSLDPNTKEDIRNIVAKLIYK